MLICANKALHSFLSGSISNDEAGPPLLPASVNGENVLLFLDSGSQICLIHEDTIRELNMDLKIKPSNLRVKGVSGNTVAIKGETYITFEWGKRSTPQKFIVIKGVNAIPGTMLLGWNWMIRSDLEIFPNRNVVKLNGKIYKLQTPEIRHTTAKPTFTVRTSKRTERNEKKGHKNSKEENITKENEQQGGKTNGGAYGRVTPTAPIVFSDQKTKENDVMEIFSGNYYNLKNSRRFHITSNFCYSDKDVTIPAFSIAPTQAKVKVKLNRRVQHTGCFVAHPLLSKVNGISLTAGLYKFSNQTTTLALMNLSPREVTIKRRQAICDIEYLPEGIEEKEWPKENEAALIATTIAEKTDEVINKAVETALKENPSPFTDANEWLTAVFRNNPSVLPTEAKPLGLTNKIEHSITVTPNATPFRIPAYRIPHSRRQLVSKEIKAMLEAGIIESSNSPYSSPLLLVPKASGEYRPVIDFRKLNENTVTENFPIPSIKSLLYDIKQNTQILSSIDLEKGYFQMNLEENSRPLTAFTTSDGHFHFVRTPMGLKNAPVTFSKLMHLILHDALEDGIFCYLDDVLITSATMAEHKIKLNKVLGKLADAGLTIKPAKCKFFQDKLVFLGHEISNGGMRPNQLKVRAVENFPIPTNVRKLREFIGMANFFRDYVKNFGTLASPLNELLKKDSKWDWGQQQQEAFEKIKTALTSAPVLTFPDYSQPFQIHTDASLVGIGATLVQLINNKPRAIAFASRKLTDTERNYSTTDREMLAITWALKHWKEIVQGYKITVFTDHAPLVNTLNPANKDPHGRRARYQVTLGEFDIDLKFIRGKMNNAPDALSRIDSGIDGMNLDLQELNEHSLPPPMASRHQKSNSPKNCFAMFPLEGSRLEPITEDRLKTEIRASPTYGPIVEAMEQGTEVPKLKHINTAELTLENGILVRISQPKNIRNRIIKSTKTVVIPESLIENVMKWAHEGNAHMGFFKTLAFIRNKYFFPAMVKTVGNYVKKCKTCPLYKGTTKQQPCGTYDPPKRPWDKVFFDILTLPRSTQGKQYLLVFVDQFSRFTELTVVDDKRADTIAKALHTLIICRYGTPEVLISDNGPEVYNEIIDKLCALYNIQRPRILPHRPQANGYCERLNRTILTRLRTLTEFQKQHWDDTIPTLQSVINGAQHNALDESPDFILYGRDKRMPYEELRSSNLPVYTGNTPETLFRNQQKLWKEVHKRIQEVQVKKRQEREDITPDPIQENKLVYHRIEQRGIKRGKLDKIFEGPYRVLKYKRNGVKCQELSSGETKMFHPDTLKRAGDVYETI